MPPVRRYREHRGQGLDSVQKYFTGTIAIFIATLWGYHLTSTGLDRPSQIGLSLNHATLLVAVVFLAVLRFLPRLRPRSSELQGAQISIIIAIFCWGMPATARETCSDKYNTFDGNLQQIMFASLCYAAVFCRVGASTFALVCLAALANLCVAAHQTKP